MRIFIGTSKNNKESGNYGLDELREKGTITASFERGKNKNYNFFGDLDKGDFVFISEDGEINHLYKVESMIRDEKNKKIICKVNIVRTFDKKINASDLVSFKYFKVDIVTVNKGVKTTTPTYNQLKLKDKYKDIDLEIADFTVENNKRNIYFTTNLRNIENKKEGDLYFVVSDKKEGYKINKLVENDGKNMLTKINLKQISNTININEYGIIGAYENSKNIVNKKSSTKEAELERIVNSLDKEGVYETSKSLPTIYDTALIVNKSESAVNKSEFSVNKSESSDNIGKIYGNFLYYGAPGCGKSYQVKKIAENTKKFTNYERVLFHPEYSYSDFVGQILPVIKDGKNLSYEFQAGPFTRILAEALKNENNNYCLIIEELNRGNAAAIFGDIFQLMDRRKKDDGDNTDKKGFKKGDSEYSITNKDITEWITSKEKGNVDKKMLIGKAPNLKIYIPHNLSIYATINTSDQNVFVLDTAFKRRWTMKYVEIDFYNDKINNFNSLYVPVYPSSKNNNKIQKVLWKDFVIQINRQISENKNGINGDDKLIGQYFVSPEDLMTAEEINKLDNNEIKGEIKSKEYQNEIKRKIESKEYQNEKVDCFAEKILMYLWNDVAKMNKSMLFERFETGNNNSIEINTIEQLIKSYKAKGLEIFNSKIKERLGINFNYEDIDEGVK